MSSTGIAIGLKRGYPVEKKVSAVRPSNKKGVSEFWMNFEKNIVIGRKMRNISDC